MIFIGCKNFTALADFLDKPHASKCANCRDRGRLNYFQRKRTDSLITNGSNNSNMSANNSDGVVGLTMLAQNQAPNDSPLNSITENGSRKVTKLAINKTSMDRAAELRVGLERLKRLAQTGIGIGAASNDSNEDLINNDNDPYNYQLKPGRGGSS